MNMLKKAILKVVVTFGLISCLGAVASAETFQLLPNCGSVELKKGTSEKEKALSKSLYSFAVSDKFCEENKFKGRLKDNIIEMINADLFGFSKNFTNPEIINLNVTKKEYKKVKKGLDKLKKKNNKITENNIKDAKKKAIKRLQEKIKKMNNLVKDYHKAEKAGEKGKEKFVVDNLKKDLKELRVMEVNDANDAKARDAIKKEIKNIEDTLKDETKLKKGVKKYFSDWKGSIRFDEKEAIPNLEGKLKLVKKFDVDSVDLKALNKGFVLEMKHVSQK